MTFFCSVLWKNTLHTDCLFALCWCSDLLYIRKLFFLPGTTWKRGCIKTMSETRNSCNIWRWKMLHYFLATVNRNIIYFRQLWRLHFLIILSRSKAVDSFLVNYAQTLSNFTLICWSVSSVSTVFLIANMLCKSDWLTDGPSGPMCSSSYSGGRLLKAL